MGKAEIERRPERWRTVRAADATGLGNSKPLCRRNNHKLCIIELRVCSDWCQVWRNTGEVVLRAARSLPGWRAMVVVACSVIVVAVTSGPVIDSGVCGRGDQAI